MSTINVPRTKCGLCSGPLKTLATATKTPKSKAHDGTPWVATFCPRCDRRRCIHCNAAVEQVDARICPNPACRLAL